MYYRDTVEKQYKKKTAKNLNSIFSYKETNYSSNVNNIQKLHKK